MVGKLSVLVIMMLVVAVVVVVVAVGFVVTMVVIVMQVEFHQGSSDVDVGISNGREGVGRTGRGREHDG